MTLNTDPVKALVLFYCPVKILSLNTDPVNALVFNTDPVNALVLNTDPVKILVELIEAVSHIAVDVVPPVADEDGLVEDGAARAKEAILAAVEMAVVINLQKYIDILAAKIY